MTTWSTSCVSTPRSRPSCCASPNSPLYRGRRHIDTLQQAVTLLGLDAVMTAALSLTLLSDHTGGAAGVFKEAVEPLGARRRRGPVACGAPAGGAAA